jgi:hypothetical protein
MKRWIRTTKAKRNGNLNMISDPDRSCGAAIWHGTQDDNYLTVSVIPLISVCLMTPLDIWWVAAAWLLVSIFERGKIWDPATKQFDLFGILFEILS